jgi:hypothetical protein
MHERERGFIELTFQRRILAPSKSLNVSFIVPRHDLETCSWWIKSARSFLFSFIHMAHSGGGAVLGIFPVA